MSTKRTAAAILTDAANRARDAMSEENADLRERLCTAARVIAARDAEITRLQALLTSFIPPAAKDWYASDPPRIATPAHHEAWDACRDKMAALIHGGTV